VWQLVVHGFRSDLPRLVSREKLAAMSALPPKADIRHRECDVRFVPDQWNWLAVINYGAIVARFPPPWNAKEFKRQREFVTRDWLKQFYFRSSDVFSGVSASHRQMWFHGS